MAGVCVGWVAICCFDTTETFSAKPITAFDILYAPVFVGAFGFGRISDFSFKLYEWAVSFGRAEHNGVWRTQTHRLVVFNPEAWNLQTNKS